LFYEDEYLFSLDKRVLLLKINIPILPSTTY
jgi:hypothetical protein